MQNPEKSIEDINLSKLLKENNSTLTVDEYRKIINKSNELLQNGTTQKYIDNIGKALISNDKIVIKELCVALNHFMNLAGTIRVANNKAHERINALEVKIQKLEGRRVQPAKNIILARN